TLRKLRFAHLALGTLPPGVSAEGSFELEHERYPLSGNLVLGGTLERLETHLALRQGDIAADARAVLAPFRPQHLVSLDASASPIDLARFSDELPQAALSLAVKATGSDRGLQGTLSLTNAAPGPLDQRRLPVASLEVSLAREAQSLRGTLAQEGMSISAEAVRRGDTVEVHSLRAAAAGGELSGSGKLVLGDPPTFSAKLVFARFDPAAFGDYPEG